MKTAITAALKASYFSPIIFKGTMEDAFILAEELGYDGVEIHILKPQDVDRREIQELCRKHILEVPTVGTGMATTIEGLSFSSPDPDVRQAAVKRIAEHIELASEIGSGVTIGLIYGSIGSEPAQACVRCQAAEDCLRQCAEKAERASLDLYLEPLNRYESDQLNTLEQAVAVIKRVGSSRVKVLADTFHLNIEEIDPVASLRKVRDHLGHVHLVDTNRESVGHGHLRVADVLQALRDAGYQGFLSFENLPRPDSRTAAEDAIATVKKFF